MSVRPASPNALSSPHAADFAGLGAAAYLGRLLGWERYWPREQEGWQSDLIDLDLPHYGPGATVADHPDLADPGEKPPY